MSFGVAAERPRIAYEPLSKRSRQATWCRKLLAYQRRCLTCLLWPASCVLLLTTGMRGVSSSWKPGGRAPMADKPSDLVQGALDMLILKTLALEPMHGYGIAVRLEQMSKAFSAPLRVRYLWRFSHNSEMG